MLLFVIVIAVFIFAWARNTRAKRQQWVARLQLPGLWVSENEEKRTLDLAGGLASGTYRSSDLGNGQWRLSGHTLLLRSDSQELALDLVFHDIGKISLECRPGERRLYIKRSGNVIPLVTRQT